MGAFAVICGLVSLALGYTYMIGYIQADLYKDLKPKPAGRHKVGYGEYGILDCGKYDDYCQICQGHRTAKYRATFWPLEYLKRPFREMLKAGELAAKDEGAEE